MFLACVTWHAVDRLSVYGGADPIRALRDSVGSASGNLHDIRSMVQPLCPLLDQIWRAGRKAKQATDQLTMGQASHSVCILPKLVLPVWRWHHKVYSILRSIWSPPILGNYRMCRGTTGSDHPTLFAHVGPATVLLLCQVWLSFLG